MQPSPPPPSANQQAHPYFQVSQIIKVHSRLPTTHRDQDLLPFRDLHPEPILTISISAFTQEFQVPAGLDTHNWYPDSGASHHVTPKSNHFTQQAPYMGSNQVHMGNGQGLKINYVGTSEITLSIHPYIVTSVFLGY